MGALMEQCPRLVDILRHVEESIFIKDKEGKFTVVSESKARHSGTLWEDMIGKTDFDFLPREQAQKSRDDELRIMETGESMINQEELLTRPDGTIVWVSVSKYARRDEFGEIIGVLGIAHDITERKKIERHILNMLSIASHDMRSPIVSIIMTIRLLLKDRFGNMDKSVKKTLSELFDRMMKLERIVGSYLVKSSIMSSNGIGRKEIIDIRQDIVDPLLDEFSDEIENKNIQIDNILGGIPGEAILVNAKTFVEASVEASKDQLMIVCRNLLDNAIKYTPPGGQIAFGFEELTDEWRINFFSSSEAIAPERRELIFKMFESESSSGIGLSVCREIIRRHGGELWYEATPDGHSNFIFTLPKKEKCVWG